MLGRFKKINLRQAVPVFIAAVVPFIMYLFTLSPTVNTGDSGAFIGALVNDNYTFPLTTITFPSF